MPSSEPTQLHPGVGPQGPRMPGKKFQWMSLPGEYGEAGMQIRVWVNYPHRLSDDISGDDPEVRMRALQQIAVEHNSWVDEEGPLPPANTSEFWDRIPDEVAASIIVLFNVESGKLPNSLIPKRRR